MGSMSVALIIMIAVIAVGGAGVYLFLPLRSVASTGFFTPRERRLAFIERVSLEGGRKLVLVRRDDVEHLVIIGGPVDVVVETGIRSERISAGATMANGHSDERWDGTWVRPEPVQATAKPVVPVEPQLSLTPSKTPADEPTLVLTPAQESKPAH